MIRDFSEKRQQEQCAACGRIFSGPAFLWRGRRYHCLPCLADAQGRGKGERRGGEKTVRGKTFL